MTTTAQQLASIDRNLRALGNGLESLETARRILELFNKRDWLLGVWTRTRTWVVDSFD